jgi:hypothetical protein
MTPEKPVNRSRWIRLLPILVPAILLGIGCQAFDRLRDGSSSNRPDPLTGMPPRTDPDRRGVNLTSTYNNPSNRTVPAGLAGTSNRSGDDLRIADSRRDERDRNLQPAAGWSGNGDERPGPGSGAQLRTPIASNSTNSARPIEREPVRSANIGAGPGPRIRTFEDGQQFLMSRGVKWQRLETTGEGEWKFSCSIPSRPGATSMKTYEARDRFGLIAMQNVIDQVVRESQR